MIWWLRLVYSFICAHLQPTISKEKALEPWQTTYLVLPSDLDYNFHMNHVVFFTIQELARAIYLFRTPFFKKLRQNGYAMVLGGVSFQFRREVHLFQTVTCVSQLIAMDDRWLYFVHMLFVGKKFVGKGVAKNCLVLTKKKSANSQRQTPHAEQILKDFLGLSQEQVELLKRNAQILAIIQTFGAHDTQLKETKQEDNNTNASSSSLESLAV